MNNLTRVLKNEMDNLDNPEEFMKIFILSMCKCIRVLTFAFSTRFILPTASLFKTKPRTTIELCKPPPNSLATRTLSTLKFAGFLGHTWMQAYITKHPPKKSGTIRTFR